jgi:hypothetical protein
MNAITTPETAQSFQFVPVPERMAYSSWDAVFTLESQQVITVTIDYDYTLTENSNNRFAWVAKLGLSIDGNQPYTIMPKPCERQRAIMLWLGRSVAKTTEIEVLSILDRILGHAARATPKLPAKQYAIKLGHC